ncbi:sugar phosphate isomerase/epimerase family protein [Chryseolinea sp. T2]|uniref:sugar phosphate isomerase/epimerase family protein n=1 Tax=Chryseolinea sp. T2 TaxID=3129255 RepID=UPI0030788EA0
MHTRRTFFRNIAALSASPLLMCAVKESSASVLPISCNAYTWLTFYQREGKEWWKDPRACAAEFVKSGIPALEPSLSSVAEASSTIEVLKEHGIKMPSVYVNSVLHKKEEAKNSIDTILAIAKEVEKYNTRIIVTNPSPIDWSGTSLKSDEELNEEAKNMELLGKSLRSLGLKLAYHTHDTELMAGAREFHHVLQNTSRENVNFCFDVHWVFRGSKNSQIAVFDVVKMYGDRTIELHIRQSVNGIWTEKLDKGDIDYDAFAAELARRKIYPHLVIEQCLESKSSNTMTAVDAHKADLAFVQRVFSPVLSQRSRTRE